MNKGVTVNISNDLIVDLVEEYEAHKLNRIERRDAHTKRVRRLHKTYGERKTGAVE